MDMLALTFTPAVARMSAKARLSSVTWAMAAPDSVATVMARLTTIFLCRFRSSTMPMIPVTSIPLDIPWRPRCRLIYRRFRVTTVRFFRASNRVRKASAASQPLIIELQNGHYVQVSSTEVDGEAPLNVPANSSAAVSWENSSANRTSEANALAPVILIFKNGDHEQVRSYSIANGILYAQGDYYTDGYWNKKIDLSALDVAETLQANTEHGVKFVLPSSPNEVITRP